MISVLAASGCLRQWALDDVGHGALAAATTIIVIVAGNE